METEHPIETSLTPDVLAELLEQIFPAILTGYDVYPTIVSDAEHLGPSAALPLQNPQAAHVSLRGTWTGIVQVTAAAETVRGLTEMMLQERDPEGEDCADALAEVANIIAGNIKGVITGENKLGLPQDTGHRSLDVEDVASMGCQDCRQSRVYVSLDIGMVIVDIILGVRENTYTGGAA